MPMNLWLALCLPALPLQLALRGLPTPDSAGPFVITEGPPERPWVSFCNEPARRAGIAPPIKLAAAQALARCLVAVPRQPGQEGEALHELACWAYQFSSKVSIRSNAGACGLLLETGASETLFGGRARLHRHIRQQLDALGYRAACAYAPTPHGAWLIGSARAGGLPARGAAGPAQLQQALAALPLRVLQWGPDTEQTLQTLGFATIGDLLALPRDAFARRFGDGRLAELDRALGLAPDPQPAFLPPARFDAGIDLPADMTQAAQLAWPAQRLLRSLEGFLRSQDAGALELTFTARHPQRRSDAPAATPIGLALAAPERDAARLARLLDERLTRTVLPAPAIRLALAVERMAPFRALNASLLPPSRDRVQGGTDWLQLAETLHARLGSERVFQLQAVDDHRPEHACRAVPLAVNPEPQRLPGVAPPGAPRPLLILPVPQPLPQQDGLPGYGGPLALLAGPERIEAGWWDLGDPGRQAVLRDYFVARNPRGQTLWIYRELPQPRGWYLHGFFS